MDTTALEILRNVFPREEGQQNSAVTGLIPIEVFNTMERSLRPFMRRAGVRAMYRGPRGHYYDQSMTHRADATGVLLYLKN